MRKTSRISCGILFALLSLPLSAAEIKGVVKDSKTKAPVAGATVVLKSPALPEGATVITEEDGRYTIPRLPAGTYTVTAIFAGDSKVENVTVTADQTLDLPMVVDLEKAVAETYTIEAPQVGSRIKRDAFYGAAPIGIVTREEATQSGLTTTNELLQSNKVTGGAGQINSFFSGFVTEGGPGAETVGLRGLGPKRTLVLLNGRRLSPAGLRGAIGSFDLTALPTAMVERVEILKDGASSIYGSDAVGGVINIVTRKDINGLTLDSNFSRSASGGAQGRISAVGGYSFDRGEISGSFEYHQREEVRKGDVDWLGCPRDLFVDKARGQTLDYIDPRTGLPKCWSLGGGGVTINTIGTNNIPNGVGAPGSVGTTFNRWRPNTRVTTGLVGFEGVGGGQNNLNVRDTFDEQMLNDTLISPLKTFNLYAQGRYNLKILGDATPFFEFLWNRRVGGSTLSRQLALDYNKNSVLIPAALAGATFSNAPTPLTVGPVGVRAFLYGGNTRFENILNQYRGTVGVQGKIGSSWNYEAATNFSLATGSYKFATWYTDRLKNSLDVTDDVNDIANTDPSLVYNGRTCRVNVGNPSGTCIPAPRLTNDVIFGRFNAVNGNSSGPDWVNYTFGDSVGTTVYSESSTVVGVDGTLFAMPFGDVKTALGLEYRTARIDDTPSLDSQNGNTYNLTTAAITRGTDGVVETYGELEIPLLAKLPGAHELTFNGSARYTHYNSYGSGFTYKVGGFYSPIKWILARANFGTSYRAPALFEQFQGATTGFIGAGNDPCSEFQGLDPNTNTYQNCLATVGQIPQADNPNYPDFIATSSVRVVNEGGAALNLKAETSKNVTAGLVLSPSLGKFGDFAFAIDYYNIEINNSVSQVGAGTILAACYNQSPADFQANNGFCRFIDPRVLPGGNLTVHDVYANVARDRVSGIDYTLRYSVGVGPGKLRVNGSLSHYFEQSNQANELDRLIDSNGVLGVPSMVGTVDLAYHIGNFKLFYGMRWTGRMSGFNGNANDPPLVPSQTPFNWDTPDYMLHDASLRYAGNSWEVGIGIRNLFNTPPPQVSSGSTARMGNAPIYSGYDFAGRSLFVNATANF